MFLHVSVCSRRGLPTEGAGGLSTEGGISAYRGGLSRRPPLEPEKWCSAYGGGPPTEGVGRTLPKPETGAVRLLLECFLVILKDFSRTKQNANGNPVVNRP